MSYYEELEELLDSSEPLTAEEKSELDDWLVGLLHERNRLSSLIQRVSRRFYLDAEGKSQ